MTITSRHSAIDAARQRAELTVEQLWLRYLALTGNADLLEVEAYLHGLVALDPGHEDKLAHAVDERLAELHLADRIDAAAVEDALDVLDELLTAARTGPGDARPEVHDQPDPGVSGADERDVDYAALFDATPAPYLVLTPDLVIVAMNRARERVTGTRRDDLVGRPVFDAFPDNPDDTGATGVRNLRASLQRVLATGQPHTMALQRYDLLDPQTGVFTERYWSPVNLPVLDEHGEVVLLLHRVEDVTDYVQARQLAQAERERAENWQRRVAEVEADLFVRARELQAAWGAEATANMRLSALADLALQLARRQTVEDVAAVVVERGLALLDADCGTLAVRAPGDVLHLTSTARRGAAAGASGVELALAAPLPAAVAAATGRRVLLADRQASLDFGPQLDDLLAATGCQAWAALPLRADGPVLGSLTFGWEQPHLLPAEETGFLEALGAQCAHALERLQRRQVERDAATATRQLSEALQRSLLTDPAQPDDLQVAVRYRPAAQEAQVGGDWHDAFLASDGATCLVIGDVVGHDREAAAGMGQLRNLLRGIAYAIADPPAAVLASLDRALRDLGTGILATALLAKIEQTADDAAAGRRRLRWSNAGHLPPLLLAPDGRTRFLGTDADLLLGLDPDTERRDSDTLLPPGATLLLYTDGLVERRNAPLDDGLTWLAERTAQLAGHDLDTLCDALLEHVDPGDDDIALLALRTPATRPAAVGAAR